MSFYYRKDFTHCIRLLVCDSLEEAYSLTKEKQWPKIEKLKYCSIFFPIDEISDTDPDEVLTLLIILIIVNLIIKQLKILDTIVSVQYRVSANICIQKLVCSVQNTEIVNAQPGVFIDIQDGNLKIKIKVMYPVKI
jgi:hypothetical protein